MFEKVAKSIITRDLPLERPGRAVHRRLRLSLGHTLDRFLLVRTALELALAAFPGPVSSGHVSARRRVVIAHASGVVTGIGLTPAGVHWTTDVLASLGLGVMLLDLLVLADPFRTRASDTASA